MFDMNGRPIRSPAAMHHERLIREQHAAAFAATNERNGRLAGTNYRSPFTPRETSRSTPAADRYTSKCRAEGVEPNLNVIATMGALERRQDR